MKKRLAVITSVVLSAGLLFGCGSGSTSATKAAGTGDKETQAAGEESKEASAAGETVTLKYDLTVSLDHPWGQAATEFKKRLEKKSGGRFVVEIYPSSSSARKLIPWQACWWAQRI